jgi:ketosteroid isomerase-like protein
MTKQAFSGQLIFIVLVIMNSFTISYAQSDKSFKQKIYDSEKLFEKMCAEKGIAEAFYFFADDSAVIKRETDTLIIGKEQIKEYYDKEFYKTAKVNWTPDFIDVSEDGTLAYTYGKYLWVSKDKKGNDVEYRGVFHTVWKRQKDNGWKYVWD